MESVQVNLDFTPNPDSLKYSVNRQILAAGALQLNSADEAEKKSPLAKALFDIGNIKSVMLGTQFVTINIENQDQLQDLNDKVMKVIRSFLESGESLIHSEALQSEQNDNRKDLSEIEQKITEILDKEIRPAVAMDGGDIALEKYEDGFVFVKMQGSCSGCPSSLMTLKMGVESRLKEAIPEIQEVIPV